MTTPHVIQIQYIVHYYYFVNSTAAVESAWNAPGLSLNVGHGEDGLAGQNVLRRAL